MFKIILFILILNSINCWELIHFGRTKNGNLGAPNVDKKLVEKKNITDQWINQNLDHFNPTDTKTWKQRYFVNSEYFDDKSQTSIVFLQIGGEGPIDEKWMIQGAWIDYAKQFSALCFQVEHRYYGKSHPTPDMSVKNLQYLSSEQALFDLAVFIDTINDQYKLSNPKWVVFGGSYAGSLAAWFRLKYPHLVVGAVSSSGPLFAELDFSEYFEVVENDLRNENEQCPDAVLRGTKQIHQLLLHRIGQESITKKFHLCDPIEYSMQNWLDEANFYETLSGNFADIAQYNKDNRFTSKTKNITLTTLCEIMTNANLGSELERLANINSLIMNATDTKCLNYKYDKMINSLRNSNWNSTTSEGGRQWTYQTCTEFGFFQTSSHRPQLFGDKFPIHFFTQQCMDIFGSKFESDFIQKGIDRSNLNYGQLNIDVTNVIFVHGSVDPWHKLGITKTKDNDAPAILIPGTAHCADMYPKSDSDPPELGQARIQIMSQIDKWIRLDGQTIQ